MTGVCWLGCGPQPDIAAHIEREHPEHTPQRWPDGALVYLDW